MMTKDGQVLVSIDVAAATVGVSRRTIYNWLSAGKVEYCRTAGGNVRIFADSLLKTVDAAVPICEDRGTSAGNRRITTTRLRSS